jgi:glycosyltransferase involved in cell wall biosynthesis
MNRGGVETWLLELLRHIDSKRFKFDFAVHTLDPCAYDDQVRQHGSKIIACMHPCRPWQYAYNLRRILRQNGPYDVVHSHVHHYSGFVLHIARKAGIPMRLSHSHSDTSAIDSSAGIFRKTYLAMMKALIRKNATLGLAASTKAAIALYSPKWRNDKKWRIFHCGIDWNPFFKKVDPKSVRSSLNLPSDAFVVGHVGRFDKPKNHLFLLEVISELIFLEPKTKLLLVGDGPLRKAVEKRVEQSGLTNCVVFAGLRSDVPQLMLGAMDVFVMPSLHEGLPLALVEAQAARLPCYISDVISTESDLVPSLCKRLSLQDSATRWAHYIQDTRSEWALKKRQVPIAVDKSAFNIEVSVKQLEKIYAG